VITLRQGARVIEDRCSTPSVVPPTAAATLPDQDSELRDQLLNMAPEWMATAMHERKVPTPKSLQT
jgi:hypothetical protein